MLRNGLHRIVLFLAISFSQVAIAQSELWTSYKALETARLIGNPVSITLVSGDSLLLPGSNARFTYRIENKSIDTLYYSMGISSKDSLGFIYSKETKSIPPQDSRSFTIISTPANFTAPGAVTFELQIIGSKGEKLNSVTTSFTISEVTKVKLYTLDLPITASNGESDTATFGIKNMGNTPQELSVYLLGSDETKKITLNAGETQVYSVPFTIPKDYYKETFQVGLVVDLMATREQISNIRPIPIYASVKKADASSNKSRIQLSQEEAVGNNGFNTIFRSRSRLQLAIGQDSRKQFKVEALNSSVRNGTTSLIVPRVTASKGFGNRRNHFLLSSGTMAIETPFYARLPRNFVGGVVDYNNAFMKSTTGVYRGYTMTNSDTVQSAGVQQLSFGNKNIKLESRNLVFTSGGQPYGLSRNFIEVKPLKQVNLKLGSHFYNRVRPESMAFEGAIAAGNKRSNMSANFLRTPRNFTPGNGLITMGEGSLSTRLGENSFSVSGSFFEQGDILSPRTISRSSIGTFNTIKPTKNLSLFAALMFFESQNTSNQGSFSLVNRNTDVRLTKELSRGSSIGIFYKNSYTDQKINSILNRNEYGLTTEIRKGQSLNLLELSYEHSTFIDRTRLSYQSYLPVSKRISIVGQSSLNYQPALRIDKFATASGEIRYSKSQQEFGIKLNTAINTNAPNLWGVTVRGSFGLALPRRSDRRLKTLEISVVDNNNNPVSNVLFSIEGIDLITNKEGSLRIETLVSDSIAFSINPRSLPFGSVPVKGLRQSLLIPSKVNTVTVNLDYTTRVKGTAQILRTSGLNTVTPRYTSYVVKITNGEKTVMRNLNPDGSFEAGGLSPGEWKISLILKDEKYNTFEVLNAVQTKLLESGELWDVSFIFKENSGKVKFQRGIGK